MASTQETAHVSRASAILGEVKASYPVEYQTSRSIPSGVCEESIANIGKANKEEAEPRRKGRRALHDGFLRCASVAPNDGSNVRPFFWSSSFRTVTGALAITQNEYRDRTPEFR